MNRKKILISASFVAMVCFAFVFNACNKKFDEPPSVLFGAIKDTANTTIKAFKALYGPVSGQMNLIKENVIIRGVVVGNDKSGNIYKTIYLQDSLDVVGGGIDLELDATGLFNNYPIGREVFVHCQGLYLANETGMLKLCLKGSSNGTTSILGIPSPVIDKYVKRGAFNNPVVATKVTLGQLNDSYQSMLISLDSFQVSSADLFKTYADISANKGTQNINIQNNCSTSAASTIIVRSSGYADFAGVRVKTGRGSIAAIFTVYNTTKQLVIRDTSDVQFKNNRCGGVNLNSALTPIRDIRALGSGATFTKDTLIEGFIVSNKDNEAAGNYRIQNENGSGVQLRFTNSSNGNGTFLLNDKVRVGLNGLSLSTFNGDLQINNAALFSVVGNGSVTPKLSDISSIKKYKDSLASTVVTISDNIKITVSSSNATGITYRFTDSKGTYIESFVRSTLNYNLVPASATSITGYVARTLSGDSVQLTLRTSDDIVGGVGLAVNPNAATLSKKPTIAALRAYYTGSDAIIASGTTITGVVISDAAAGNMSKGTLVIQDATAGINIFYGSSLPTTGFNIGDSIVVDISGGTLTSFNQLVQVTKLTALPTTKLATGINVVPKVVTISDFVANIATYECMLVKVVNATATSASGNFSGNATLTDASGTTILRTASAATFSSSPLPTTPKTFVGYGTRFNAAQLNIRNLSDVQ